MKSYVDAWVLASSAATLLLVLLLHLYAALRTKRWLPAKGLSFEAKTSLRKPMVVPNGLLAIDSVAYQYEINGTLFRGTHCYALSAKPFAGGATERFLESIERARKNGSFTVFVNPRDPSRAVLSTGMPWELFAFIGFVLLVAFVVLSMMVHEHPEVFTAPLLGSAVLVGVFIGALFAYFHL